MQLCSRKSHHTSMTLASVCCHGFVTFKIVLKTWGQCSQCSQCSQFCVNLLTTNDGLSGPAKPSLACLNTTKITNLHFSFFFLFIDNIQKCMLFSYHRFSPGCAASSMLTNRVCDYCIFCLAVPLVGDWDKWAAAEDKLLMKGYIQGYMRMIQCSFKW